MNNLMNAYENQNTLQGTGNTLAQASASREMEEVKGQIFMAKQFPRNIFQSEQRILDNCKRSSLAQVAVYSYPRGGTKVEGPSIRLAEVLAQNWGNLAYGVKELEQKNGESVAMAYAWDLETNVRQEKVFTVPHTRHTKNGAKKLTDPRDIYELVANNGARRLRSCILGIIPGDIVDKAVEECNKTMSGNNEQPLSDRINQMLQAFKEQYGVTQSQIEAYCGYNISAFTGYDVAKMIKVFNSLKNGMSKVEDWFAKDDSKKPSKLELAMEDKKVEENKETIKGKGDTPKIDPKEKKKLEDITDGVEQAELL
ncbi:hypothetical protein [Macrococcoides caseolyticum]|uniref:Uncharacterized protein n=1 Tax=Macrococcus caseolyticus (strain JCSC5402) TaxID=458233 RepID=B9EBK5_MACCJ|nr:hypothetical protein [Macrococcus caseolyticus]BAH17616.1 hypothetical protein MCCL_0909 [Macrococcus caseolyticus JCSC5402]